MNLEQMGQAARAAAYTLAETSTRAKNQALLVMADALRIFWLLTPRIWTRPATTAPASRCWID